MIFIPEITDEMDCLTAAFAYAAAGWYVLPVKDGTKHPGSVVGKAWPALSSRDPKTITAWFAGTNHGIALHAGRSGAVIIDVDDPNMVPDILARHLDAGPHQSSRPHQPRRGHYPFLMPEGRALGNGLGGLSTTPKWGEIRGANGIIIAAPSLHPEGGEYRWIRAGVVPALPGDIAALLPEGTDAADAASDAAVASFLAKHTTANRPEVLQGWVAALRNKIEGGESCHMSAVSTVTGAMKEARVGYFPATEAVEALKAIFVSAVALGGSTGNRRTGQVAESEWAGIVSWAVGQALGADLDQVHARVAAKMPNRVETVDSIRATNAPPPKPISLDAAHTVFRRWLGDDYDTQALDAVLATAAVERLDGDPVWLLLISGPGNAKTETVQSLDGIGAVVASSISSEAALLSATPKRERAKNATGGLLRKLGPRGVLVIKDVTSILSMNRDLRARVLAALREIYDGRWYRDVGSDGGQTIPWEGRITVVGAVTTAWDAAHAVISSMGDRFVLLRMDSTTGRQSAGRKAISNTGDETRMRAELAAAVAGVLAGMNTTPITVTDAETNILLAAADLVTLARTGVEYDYRGDVIDAHAPEMPTRFAKQLAQVVRGGVAIGMDRTEALRLAIRCARDSMPPLRLAIIDDLATHRAAATGDIRRRLDKPRNTVDRQLQALHMLGVVTVEEEYREGAHAAPRWLYSLADGIDPDAIDPKTVPEMSPHTPNPQEEETKKVEAPENPGIDTDISGTTVRRRDGCVCAEKPQPCYWCQQAAS
ncbi:bifunctional DNA primase/polymerase [Mycobacterium marinum]|uniref:bifunctional DNA primase/polymerase n=1 Tax=Mycobacterium marinum TaxID=1781 RepID=UPI002359DA40|nr:bifunctional DNA primase/polymerase [Mycobacterium marinum]MDC8981245.1 bifunctional DNA primase/polymerase [Mycobacterium marinum]